LTSKRPRIWRRPPMIRRLERAGVAAAVDQQVLTCDVAGLRRAEVGKVRAELRRIAVTPGRARGGALAPDLVEGFAQVLEHAFDVTLLRVAVEDSWQQVVDRDIAGDRLARETR